MGLDFLHFGMDMVVVLQRGKEMGAMFPFQKDACHSAVNHSLAGSIQNVPWKQRTLLLTINICLSECYTDPLKFHINVTTFYFRAFLKIF